MKLVINKCYGGFGFSRKAVDRLIELGCKEAAQALQDHFASGFDHYHVYDVERTDPLFVQVVEELGDKASGQLADLRVIEIPDGIDYYIDDYDGIESVHERHASWG